MESGLSNAIPSAIESACVLYVLSEKTKDTEYNFGVSVILAACFDAMFSAKGNVWKTFGG
jgi:hypothetical protein